MDGIFGRGIAFDCTIIEEWSREELIAKILDATDEYTPSMLHSSCLSSLQLIADDL